MREIELLSPAANKDVAYQAILHGADAVYMGASSHGARKKASNSLEDIAEVVEFAHTFHSRVYVTVNTLVFNNELQEVENLISRLYKIGVDALIIQDMGILRMDIPPVALHSSTQCDTRTVEKARFLESVGFSQIVLARELSITEIKKICDSVSIPVETFIHGALCVSYSGRCRASFASNGRSANRGECAQMCRMPYDLVNSKGERILKNKYLLSLRDFNASENIENLMEAGVSSFKIEGRLKDASYVKNVTAYYRRLIDEIISMHPDKYRRSSFGKSHISFIPNLSKSFNRGFTSYFLKDKHDDGMASLDTPKSMGEEIDRISDLHNGDGISFFNNKGEYEGVRVNAVSGSRIIGARPFKMPTGCAIHRTYDREWQTMLDKKTATRKMWLDLSIDNKGLTAVDERGIRVRIPLDVKKETALKEMHPEQYLSKLGNTSFYLRNFENSLDKDIFIRASEFNDIKRRMLEALDSANLATYPYQYRKKENFTSQYPLRNVGSEENISNRLAEDFYRSHGVKPGDRAIEVDKGIDRNGIEVMHTRYCLRRELGLCKKSGKRKPSIPGLKESDLSEPLYLETGPNRFRIKFDCGECGMRLYMESDARLSRDTKG